MAQTGRCRTTADFCNRLNPKTASLVDDDVRMRGIVVSRLKAPAGRSYDPEPTYSAV